MIKKNVLKFIAVIIVLFNTVNFSYAQAEKNITANKIQAFIQEELSKDVSAELQLKETDNDFLKSRFGGNKFEKKSKDNPFTQLDLEGEYFENVKSGGSVNSYNKNKIDNNKVQARQDAGGKFYSERWRLPRGAIEYGIEGGFAPKFATWMSGPKYFDISGKKHLLASFRWGRIYSSKRFVTFSWAVEFVPLNLAIGNEIDNRNYSPGSGQSPTKRENTYGVAFNPASFRFIFLPKMRLRPQLGAGFGVSRHLNRIPTIDGTKGNAMIDFQIGAQYMISEKKAINFGYRYFHLSNIYLSHRNPGYNMNMFFIGYSLFKKK